METVGSIIGDEVAKNMETVVQAQPQQFVQPVQEPGPVQAQMQDAVVARAAQKITEEFKKDLPELLVEAHMADALADASMKAEAEKERYYIWGHHMGQDREFSVLKVTPMRYMVGDFPCSGVLHQTIAARQVRMSAYERSRLTYVEGRRFVGHCPAEGNLRIPGTFYLRPLTPELALQLEDKDPRAWGFIMKQSHRDYLNRRRERSRN
jgi:hypothetical protein